MAMSNGIINFIVADRMAPTVRPDSCPYIRKCSTAFWVSAGDQNQSIEQEMSTEQEQKCKLKFEN